MPKEDKYKEYLEAYMTEIEEKKKLVKSEEYFLWLDIFTQKHPYFCDDSWNYNEDRISKEDYIKVKHLDYFFIYIRSLAYKQNILSSSEDDDETYYFRLKNKIYKISEVSGQGTFTSLSLLENNNNVSIVKVDENITIEEIKNRELIQYIIINKDYIGKIDSAKFGVHIGHACTLCAMKEQNSEIFQRWYQNGKLQKKIILTAKTSKLEELEENFYSVRDLGLTEVKEGTLLALSLGIMTREQAIPYIKRMQTWKDNI